MFNDYNGFPAFFVQPEAPARYTIEYRNTL